MILHTTSLDFGNARKGGVLTCSITYYRMSNKKDSCYFAKRGLPTYGLRKQLTVVPIHITKHLERFLWIATCYEFRTGQAIDLDQPLGNIGNSHLHIHQAWKSIQAIACWIDMQANRLLKADPQTQCFPGKDNAGATVSFLFPLYHVALVASFCRLSLEPQAERSCMRTRFSQE